MKTLCDNFRSDVLPAVTEDIVGMLLRQTKPESSSRVLNYCIRVFSTAAAAHRKYKAFSYTLTRFQSGLRSSQLFQYTDTDDCANHFLVVAVNSHLAVCRITLKRSRRYRLYRVSFLSRVCFNRCSLERRSRYCTLDVGQWGQIQ